MRDPSEELDNLRDGNLLRRTRTFEGNSQNQIRVGDTYLTQFASNDYLGLADSEVLKQAFLEAVETYGVGSGASRLITGTQSAHEALETELADFKQTERALVFSSGYAAAVGLLTAVLGTSDVVILDKLCHACLIDGARLCGAKIRVFPHNNLEMLEKHLKWAQSQVAENGRILVATESIFSMDGDLSPLHEVVTLKDQYGALLLLDEAHAVGVIGPEGRGLAEELGVQEAIDFAMGTLSKAIGVSGGYIAASTPWIDLLINRARSFIYSTAPPPALAATAKESIRLLRSAEGDHRRARLRRNAARLDDALKTPHPSSSAIRPHFVGDSQQALNLSRELETAGFLVPAIRFPTVPRGTERLRISVNADHTFEQIDGLAAAIRDF